MHAPQMTSSGPTSFSRACASSSRFSRRYAARNTIRKIFENSPGWKRNEPTCTQSRAPLTVVPMPGTRGRNRSRIAPIPKRYFTCSSTR